MVEKQRGYRGGKKGRKIPNRKPPSVSVAYHRTKVKATPLLPIEQIRPADMWWAITTVRLKADRLRQDANLARTSVRRENLMWHVNQHVADVIEEAASKLGDWAKARREFLTQKPVTAP